jgi:hypothetical protein
MLCCGVYRAPFDKVKSNDGSNLRRFQRKFQQHGSGARRQQDYSQAAESTLMKAKNRSEHAAGLTAVITTK